MLRAVTTCAFVIALGRANRPAHLRWKLLRGKCGGLRTSVWSAGDLSPLSLARHCRCPCAGRTRGKSGDKSRALQTLRAGGCTGRWDTFSSSPVPPWQKLKKWPRTAYKSWTLLSRGVKSVVLARRSNQTDALVAVPPLELWFCEQSHSQETFARSPAAAVDSRHRSFLGRPSSRAAVDGVSSGRKSRNDV